MLSGKRHCCSQRDTSRNKNVVRKLKIDYREKDSTPKKNVAKEQQRNHFKEECDQAHGKTVFFGYRFLSVPHYNSERCGDGRAHAAVQYLAHHCKFKAGFTTVLPHTLLVFDTETREFCESLAEEC